MRNLWPLAVLALLASAVAGCSGAPAPRQQDEVGEDEGRASVGGSGDNTTQVWEHTIAWTPEAAPPPTTMVVPVNVTDLVVTIHNRLTAPCGTTLGEPGPMLLAPQATFTSPSGAVQTVDLFANECQAGGASVYSSLVGGTLAAEPGEWQVAFAGRGVGLQQRLVVEGELVSGNATAGPAGNATAR